MSKEKKYLDLGLDYIDSGKYEKAIKSFKKAIKIDPDDAETYNALGLAYGKTGMTEKAIQSFKKAIEIDPDTWAHFNLGVAYFNSGRFQEAVEPYKQAVRIDPDDPMANYGLGGAFFLSKDTGSALKQYEILKSLDSELADKFLSLMEQ